MTGKSTRPLRPKRRSMRPSTTAAGNIFPGHANGDWMRARWATSPRRLSAVAAGQAPFAQVAEPSAAHALSADAAPRRSGVALGVGVARADAGRAEESVRTGSPARPAIGRVGVEVMATGRGLAARLRETARRPTVAGAGIGSGRRAAGFARTADGGPAPAEPRILLARARRRVTSTVGVLGTAARAGDEPTDEPPALIATVGAATAAVGVFRRDGALAPV